jgi:hypothetical protein
VKPQKEAIVIQLGSEDQKQPLTEQEKQFAKFIAKLVVDKAIKNEKSHQISKVQQ